MLQQYKQTNLSDDQNLNFSILFFTSCSQSKWLSKQTQNPLQESYRLNNGMTKEDVIANMGQPIRSDFYKNVDEWFYCKTGKGGDQHLALYFYDEKLIAKKNYIVTLRDTDGQTGSCELFIKKRKL